MSEELERLEEEHAFLKRVHDELRTDCVINTAWKKLAQRVLNTGKQMKKLSECKFEEILEILQIMGVDLAIYNDKSYEYRLESMGTYEFQIPVSDYNHKVYKMVFPSFINIRQLLRIQSLIVLILTEDTDDRRIEYVEFIVDIYEKARRSQFE